MIRRDQAGWNGVLAWHASGTVTREDVRDFQQQLRAAAPTNGGARVLLDLVAMNGADLDAIWQDAKQSLEYVQRIDRVAVIGDARWEEWLTRLAAMVPGIHARYFAPTQVIEARAWLGAS